MEEKVTLVFIRNMESRVGFSRNEDTFDRHFGAPCISLWFPSWVTLSSKRKGNTFKLFCDDFVTTYIYIYICKSEYSLDIYYICDRRYGFTIVSISWLKIAPLLARDIGSRHSFGKYIFGQMLENERGLCARNSNDKRVDLERSVVDGRRTNATGTVTSSYSTQGENLYYKIFKMIKLGEVFWFSKILRTLRFQIKS